MRPPGGGYTLGLTCPYDGSPVDHIASGTTDGWTTSAVARCRDCHTELLITVHLAAPNGDRRMTPARRKQLADAHAKTYPQAARNLRTL